MNLKEILSAHQIMHADAVDAIKEKFPGFDKSAFSKVCNPEKYGIALVPEAQKILHSKFPVLAREAQKRPTSKRKTKHRLTRYVKCRLTDEDFEALQLKLSASGGTAQAMLTQAIRDYTTKGASDDE